MATQILPNLNREDLAWIEYVQAFLVMIIPWLGNRRKEKAIEAIKDCCRAK